MKEINKFAYRCIIIFLYLIAGKLTFWPKLLLTVIATCIMEIYVEKNINSEKRKEAK